MVAKKAGSGLGARMAAAPTSNAVAAGFAAATGTDLPEAVPEPEAPTKVEAVALNIRLPKDLHRTLRRIAFDEETSINALLIAGAEAMLAKRKASWCGRTSALQCNGALMLRCDGGFPCVARWPATGRPGSPGFR